MKIVAWYEYTNLLDKLYDEIRLRTFDSIVGIGRGGSLVAAYMSSKMGIPTFCSVFVRHTGEGESMKIMVHDLCQIDAVRGRVLVVDDWLDQGIAMKFVLEKLHKDTTITTLVLFNRRGSTFKADIVGEYVDENERRIMFPYDLP
ncbi:MAG: Pribosyltran protein [Thermoproteota archaeon]|nr:Pribosyltran protein [Thermoproteota archaeon]